MSRAAVFLVFFFSGVIALGYQSIWSKYLGHLLGHAALAQTLAVSAFMLGLGLGSYWAGKKGQMSGRTAMLCYVVLEIGIGLWGLSFHSAYTAVEAWFASSLLSQYALALLLIVPPATAMGATFPVFWRGATQLGILGEARALPSLYFVNALGGSVGALLTTFVLVPDFGLPGSMLNFGLGNLALAVVVFLLYVKRADRYAVPQAMASAAGETAPDVSTLPRFGVFALIAALTGATSLIYQVVWFRMAALALGSSQHSFEIVLACFIFALAVGALVLSWIDKYVSNAIAWCAAAQVAMGCMAILSYVFWYAQFPLSADFVSTVNRGTIGYDLFLIFSAFVCLIMVFPASFWAGMTLPLLTRSALGFGPKVVGYLYAWNTAGCMLGAIVATHLLLANIGIKLTLILAGALDIFLGLYLLGLLPATKRRMYWMATAGGLSLVCILAAQLTKVNPLVVTSGSFRHGVAHRATDNRELLFYRDGKTATISTVKVDDRIIAVATNGKVDGAASLDARPEADEITMILTGILGSLYHPNPATVMIIGFGTGLSTHTQLGDNRVKHLTTVEIEPAIIDGASHLIARNNRAYQDPRSHIVINDAKSFMRQSKTGFDVIVSEPSNPWVGGTSNLFTKEFYHAVKKKLNSGGTFVQWLQTYETNDAIAASALLALGDAFGTFRVFDMGQSDWIIVARPDNNYRLYDEVLLQQNLADDFKRIGVRTPDDILARIIASEKEARAVASAIGAPANSDYQPYLLANAPRARFVSGQPEQFVRLRSGLNQRATLELLQLDVQRAEDFVGQNFAPESLATKNEELEVVRAVVDQSGALDFDSTFSLLVQMLTSLRTCDLKQQDALLRSLGHLLAPFGTIFRYPELETTLQQGMQCEGINANLRLVLEFLHSYSTRDYAKAVAIAPQLIDNKNLQKRDADALRLMAISAARIAKNCAAAKSFLGPNVQLAERALVNACDATSVQ
jgi:spermidine synthase